MNKRISQTINLTLYLSLLFTFSCARFPVQEISDARILMEAAKNSCAKAYMPDDMEEGENMLLKIEEGVQKERNMSKSEFKKMAFGVQRISKKMINQAARIKSELYDQIQQEIVQAIKKIHEGEKAEANRYARKEYKKAIESVREARKLSQDECRYKEALEKSKESVQYAEESVQSAIAFKENLEKTLPVYHIVKEGETLKSIAKSSPIYKDEAYWDVIYRANRDQVRDPKVLYPGQQLYLPGKKEIGKYR